MPRLTVKERCAVQLYKLYRAGGGILLPECPPTDDDVPINHRRGQFRALIKEWTGALNWSDVKPWLEAQAKKERKP